MTQPGPGWGAVEDPARAHRGKEYEEKLSCNTRRNGVKADEQVLGVALTSVLVDAMSQRGMKIEVSASSTESAFSRTGASADPGSALNEIDVNQFDYDDRGEAGEQCETDADADVPGWLDRLGELFYEASVTCAGCVPPAGFGDPLVRGLLEAVASRKARVSFSLNDTPECRVGIWMGEVPQGVSCPCCGDLNDGRHTGPAVFWDSFDFYGDRVNLYWWPLGSCPAYCGAGLDSDAAAG